MKWGGVLGKWRGVLPKWGPPLLRWGPQPGYRRLKAVFGVWWILDLQGGAVPNPWRSAVIQGAWLEEADEGGDSKHRHFHTLPSFWFILNKVKENTEIPLIQICNLNVKCWI